MALMQAALGSQEGPQQAQLHAPDSYMTCFEEGEWQVFPVRAAVPINLAIRATLHFEASGNPPFLFRFTDLQSLGSHADLQLCEIRPSR